MIERNPQSESELLARGLSRTVYSFYFPETRKLVDELWTQRPHELYEKAYLQPHAGLHEEFGKTWLSWAQPLVHLSRKDFPHFYPCQGSSEAIRDLIAHIGVRSGRIHVFGGEYEGYAAYARAFQVPIQIYDRENYTSLKESCRAGDYFFISQPSSLDGNDWTGFSNFIQFVEQNCPGLKVAVDLCYIGTIAPKPDRIPLKLNSAVIATVFISLSKVYGVYYHRIGGVFHREPALSLVGNEYFRNLFSLKLGIELMKRHDVFALPNRYRPVQEKLISQVQDLGPLSAADCVLLANGPKAQDAASDLYKYLLRQNHVRVCLTPGLDRMTSL